MAPMTYGKLTGQRYWDSPKLRTARKQRETLHEEPPKYKMDHGRGALFFGRGRYRAKTKNLDALNKVALAVFEKGFVPVIGVNGALPLIRLEGKEDSFDRIMMPLSLAMSERCDACLRVGGPSKGADQEVERFRAEGKPVFFSLEEIPDGKMDLPLPRHIKIYTEKTAYKNHWGQENPSAL